MSNYLNHGLSKLKSIWEIYYSFTELNLININIVGFNLFYSPHIRWYGNWHYFEWQNDRQDLQIEENFREWYLPKIEKLKFNYV